jgi:Replication-relaxation
MILTSFFLVNCQKETGHDLCWWETGPVCERRYQVGEQWYNLKPDALAEYRIGKQQMLFWLEWDRGTMNVRDLAVKFTSYASYIASREWAREHSKLPVLICVAPDIARGAAHATSGSGQAHAFTWSRVVGNYSRVVEGPRTSRFYLGCRVNHRAVKEHSQTLYADNACSM